MKKIKYFDKINKRYVDLEVSDEVAKSLKTFKKKEDRENKKWNKNIVSLDLLMEMAELSEDGSCDVNNLVVDDNYFIDEDVAQSIREYEHDKIGHYLKKLHYLIIC